MLGDIMNVNKKNKLKTKETNISLDDMVGKYKSIEPINRVNLKHKMK